MSEYKAALQRLVDALAPLHPSGSMSHYRAYMRAEEDAKALLARPEPASAEKAREWRPISSAPKDRSILLRAPFITYCGRYRFGNLGEPQQDQIAWRCDSSGRFANPTFWQELPSPPATDQQSPEEDPTPWCSACGAKTRANCNCGPIAENE